MRYINLRLTYLLTMKDTGKRRNVDYANANITMKLLLACCNLQQWHLHSTMYELVKNIQQSHKNEVEITAPLKNEKVEFSFYSLE